MSAAFREAMPAGRRPLLIVGGPRFDEAQAAELGVDRIFGRGTTPREVASYLVAALVGRPDTGRHDAGHDADGHDADRHDADLQDADRHETDEHDADRGAAA